ncbi:uncharacterized protein H6S33_006782 [Morchella sextelata]|uniref:uncharacterized protein n=1 Tax=Morchella sextelata TaxID=1174677 RepID=UPI001D04E270|nr:uncharacterized protein H6S33_006782 [Morchella sextelata]KAH0604405.1 hypothetical protein H6S33_006782 [Morchella sextelata]
MTMAASSPAVAETAAVPQRGFSFRRASRRLSLSKTKAPAPPPESRDFVKEIPTAIITTNENPFEQSEKPSSTPLTTLDELVADTPSLQPSATFEVDTSTEKGQPRITISTFLKSPDVIKDTSYQHPALSSSSSAPDLLDLNTRPVSETFRRSWSSPSVSRSTSPGSRDGRNSRDEEEYVTGSSVSSSSPTNSGEQDEFNSDKNELPVRPGLSRTPSTMSKVTRRPLSVFMKSSASEPSIPIMAEKAGINKKVKDEIFEAFRLLENDFQRFQSKSSVQKANVLRQSLLPFLRKYHQQSSVNISPDELDKRVRSLHRWWTGLLAQLRNRNSQAIAGADRPAYLEGISGLMSRPEWRAAPSSFAPLSLKCPSSSKSQSTSSLASTSSAYSVQKSVQHNIKVLFTRTLFDTLAYTVEKMGLRTVPPSLVAFGGKVLAYAFYFCSGVAEMLIRLLGIQAATVRRVLPEFGVGRGINLSGVAEGIIADFPETLQSLGFTTLASTLRQMKQPTKLPIGGSQVDWYGPWTNRWCGRDSDLLFVFLKYYHILLCDYLPPNISATARIAAPGYVLVHAHILSILDTTIHRKPASGPEPSASTTFEDMLANATAAIPMTARNILRTMAENKMVVLLRDMVTDKTNCSDKCRELYAESFMGMLKAAVKKTRVFDADACFTLCDLMEEVLPIFSQAEMISGAQMVDWPFWMDVVKQMSESHNNMTELRLVAFVYTSWDVIVEDEERKRALCLEWLLSKPTWERFFCHWCPMVRAYFMRLVCWRLARCEGSESALDQEILETLLLRLRISYAHYQRLRDTAEMKNGALPSTAPCLPAPCRRLVILRNDIMTTPQGVLLDGIIPTAIPILNPEPAKRSNSSTSSVSSAISDAQSVLSDTSTETTQSTETVISTFSRRWSQIRNVIGFRSAATQSESTPEPTSPETPPFRKRTSSLTSTNVSPKRETTPPKLPVPQKKTTFKFSIEWMERPPYGNRDRKLGLPRLPAPAQTFLDSNSKKSFEIDMSGCHSYGSQWTYAGRALAEWILVVVEYENFFERRKMEGKECDKDVETPSLGVDSARKF